MQRRAIDIAYTRYRHDYPGVPELQTLLPFADETAGSVHFEFIDRKHWEDLQSGKVESVPEDYPQYEIPRSELGIEVKRAKIGHRGRSVGPSNNPINPTVVPVTRLACARRAPAPPAGYRER